MQFSENVTLLGAGKAKRAVIVESLGHAPVLIAADGGAKIAVKMGQTPQFVVGDFDSIDSNTLKRIPQNRRLRITEQDSTDFEKCLALLQAPLILGVGFLGRRLDHQLAALNALVKFPSQTCVLLNNRDLCFHLPANFDLALKPGTRVSLFPMAPVQGRAEGLAWPIEGLDFAPAGRIGTSNSTTGAALKLRMDGPGMLIILPRAALGSVIAALQPR